MFISSHTLHQLLKDDIQEKVTDELIQFIVDLLNFRQEYSLSNNEHSDKLSDKIIFQSQVNKNKLNTLMLIISKNDDVKSSDANYSRELSLLRIVGHVYNIICPERNEWIYDYERRNIDPNDLL